MSKKTGGAGVGEAVPPASSPAPVLHAGADVPRRIGRDTRLEFLRLLGAFATVWIHVCADAVMAVDLESTRWWLINYSEAASRWGGSAIFLMIGGALLLSRDSTSEPLRFVGERLRRLLPALVFWTLFYLAWRAWRTGLPAWPEVAVEIAQGTPYYHMWFVYMLVGMMLVVPVLRCVVLAKPYMAWYLLAVCALLTVVDAMVAVWLGSGHASFFGLVPLLVVYFLGGHLCYQRNWRIHPGWLLAMMLLLPFLIANVLGGLYPLVGERAFAFAYSNRGPLVMMLAFTVFIAGLMWLPRDAERWSWYRRRAAPVAHAGMGIYMVHPFWIATLADWGISVHRWPSVWAVVLLICAVYALSVLSVLVIARLPGGRKVVL